MSLSINNIVNPTLLVAATPQAARDFGIGLLLTSAATLPGGARVTSCSSAADVATLLPSDTHAQADAVAYFAQSPAPKTLKVGIHIPGDADATAALNACAQADPNFYGLACVNGASTADQQLAAAFAESTSRVFFYSTEETDCLTPATPPTNMLYLVGNAGRSRSAGIYADPSPALATNVSAHLAMMALYMTIDYNNPNGLKTAMFRQMSGVSTSAITQAQYNKICGNNDGSIDVSGALSSSSPMWNGNTYSTFGTTSMFSRGKTGGGRWMDEIIALDWLVSNIQVGFFNALQAAATAGCPIPQTDAGSAQLIMGIQPVLDQARSAGLCAPGVWTFQGVGSVKTGDVIPTGYYVYAAPVSSMSLADKPARKAPPILILVVGAGAIQYCAPTIIFQR